jgi:hypothetical protein
MESVGNARHRMTGLGEVECRRVARVEETTENTVGFGNNRDLKGSKVGSMGLLGDPTVGGKQL